jgi:hypothetical protein
VRKFTRKSKKEEGPVEMVLAPEEWKGPQMTKEQLYRQYFLFWQSWQDELIQSLLEDRSQKKRIDCTQQAIKNLVNLKPMLNTGKQKKLDVYLDQLDNLLRLIQQDTYGVNNDNYMHTAERLKIGILQNFSYKYIKNDLI